MRNIQLLDCTLRDGGYVNDWEFGHDTLLSVFQRLVSAGVDLIEVGFLDERRPYDSNRSIFPDTKSVDKIWGGIDKGSSMAVGMIDFGTCPIENLQPCSESYLDVIRVIFKKEKMHAAMEYCREVKKLGYKVCSQLVSVTAYNDEELLQVIELVNDVKPYAVSMVDTYGLLDPTWLLHIYSILDAHVDKDIAIGFHAHNNLQLGYANARAFVAKETDRAILVDGTLFGMGKSAGNAPLELVAKYLNEEFVRHYDINAMMEAIDESVNQFYAKSPWGYKTFFYTSSLNKCHPNYVQYYQNKGSLSPTKLNKILSEIEPQPKKLLYDEKLAEELYQKFVSEEFHDEEEFKKLLEVFAGQSILLIGPGKNIVLQKDKVEKYIAEKHPVKIAINYIPEIMDVDYIFLTKPNRYEQMTTALQGVDVRVIATSNMEPKKEPFDYVINREPLLEKTGKIKDNSFLMLLQILQNAGVKQVACAGLDGYSAREDNYASPEMEYGFVKKEADYLNEHIKNVLHHKYSDMQIEFITFSQYNVVQDISSGTF